MTEGTMLTENAAERSRSAQQVPAQTLAGLSRGGERRLVRTRVVLSGVVGLGLLGLVAGCAADVPSPEPSVSLPVVTPSPTPEVTAEAPTETPAPIETEKPEPKEVSAETQELLDTMAAMSFEQFVEDLTDEERALYVNTTYLRKIKSEADLFVRESKNGLDHYPANVSPTSTYNEALSQVVAIRRAGLVVANNDSYEEGLKIVASTYKDGKITSSVMEYLAQFEESPYRTLDGFLISFHELMPRTFEGEETQVTSYVDDEGRACYEATRGSRVGNACATEYKDKYGDPAYTWIN